MQGITFPSTVEPTVGPGSPAAAEGPSSISGLDLRPLAAWRLDTAFSPWLWQEGLLGKGDTQAWGTEAQAGTSGQHHRMKHGRARSPDCQAGAVILNSQG